MLFSIVTFQPLIQCFNIFTTAVRHVMSAPMSHSDSYSHYFASTSFGCFCHCYLSFSSITWQYPILIVIIEIILILKQNIHLSESGQFLDGHYSTSNISNKIATTSKGSTGEMALAESEESN
jgi:hypothetical protein